MKTAILSPSASPGGLYRVAMEEARYFQNEGDETRFISLIKPVNPWSEMLNGLHVTYLSDYRGPTPFLSELLNRNLFPLRKINSSEYDVVVCHNLPSCYAVKRSGRSSTKLVGYIHDPIQFTLTANVFQLLFRSRGLRRHFAEKWLDRVDVILVNSERSRKILKRELDLESSVLYPSMASFDNSLPEVREDFFLCVGRIGFHPAFNILLAIMKVIPEMKLVIAGSWSHTASQVTQMFSEDHEIAKRVTFITNPTDQVLKDLYRRARAFIYPGIENFNMSALEAISNGCPIIISKESGVCEVLGDYGFSAESTRSDLFAEMVRTLLTDDQRAIDEGKRLFERVKQYDRAAHMKRLRSLINV